MNKKKVLIPCVSIICMSHKYGTYRLKFKAHYLAIMEGEDEGMKLNNAIPLFMSAGYKSAMFFLMIVIILFLPTHHVFSKGFGDCDYADIKEFKQNGFSPEDIRGICQPGKSLETKKQTGQRCKTKNGVCGLYHLPPAPLGVSCYCVNKYSGFNDKGNVIN